MSKITIAPDGSSAVVFGNVIKGQSPTEVYVSVMTEILGMCPRIIGQKETHFTSDKSRADRYTGTTREVLINGMTVYIKTGFSTKDKIKGIEKTCQLAGIDFSVTYEQEDDFFADFGDVDFGFDTDFSSETKENIEDDPFADVDPFDDDFFNVSNDGGLDFDFSDVMQEDQTANESVSADTTDSENFDPELNFAFHSEYYIKDREPDRRSHNYPARVLFDNFAYYNKNIYFSLQHWFKNTIFKIYPDKTIKAIVSKDKNFIGNEMAVNRHGIFCKDNTKFYLFGEDGKLKSKLTLKQKQPAGIYIYDHYIYSVSVKGDLYCHDILNNNSEPELVWSFSDFKSQMFKSFEEYSLSIDPRKKISKFKIRTIDVNTLCCNEEHIIVGFDLEREYTFYVAINKVTKECKILDTSDNRADFKIFSFDMSKNIMWWSKKNEDRSLSLFSTPIQSYQQTKAENHEYTFLIAGKYSGGSSSTLDSTNFYFNGILASGNNTIRTFYADANGNIDEYYDTYQSNYSSIINGEWMFRGNIGRTDEITLVPYKFGKLNKCDEWWTITQEELEAAYEKAISEK